MPNLVSLTCLSLQILLKFGQVYSWFPDFWSIPYKRKLAELKNQWWYWHEASTSNQTRQGKQKNNVKKSWWLCHIRKLWRHDYFFDLWLIWSNPKAGFQTHSSLLVTFYLREIENRTKKSLTQLSHYCYG